MKVQVQLLCCNETINQQNLKQPSFLAKILKKNQDEIDKELRMLMMKITMELMRMMIMKNIKCFTRKKSTNQQIINI